MDEWTDRQKSEHATVLLNDPLMLAFFESTERELFESWSATPADAAEVRERIYYELGALRSLRARLRQYVADHAINERFS